jgi:predicted nucleotidyltransferase
MRIDPKGMIAGCPALAVRKALRYLRDWHQWEAGDLEAAAALVPGTGSALVKALRTEGLIEASARGAWTVTQAGRTVAAATAAKPVSRATAERALAQFLERVTRVNESPYFLAKVTRVVLFGSMLRLEVDRLSDVDVAVEVARKEADFERARLQNQQRAEELAEGGRRFRSFLEWEACWYLEAFRFLKGRSRVISLADYCTERAFVLAAPHRVLIGDPEPIAVDPAPMTPQSAPRIRRPRGCPF